MRNQLYKMSQNMKFQSFSDLAKNIQAHNQYDSDIKKKRLKKQLEMLSNYQKQSTTIQSIELSSIGIQLLVVNTYRHKHYQYKLVLDFQYPFSRPRIHYLKKESLFAYAKDLIDILLEGSNWGPSLIITFFLDKIQNISEIINENSTYISKQSYRFNEVYRKTFLTEMGLQIYQIEEYTWKYWIKSTKKRYLGLTSQALILFSSGVSEQNLVLDFWKPINQIITAKATVSSKKKFSLQIVYKENEKNVTVYLGGTQNIQKILGILNPIQMIQRKMNLIQKNPASVQLSTYWSDSADMVREISQLIEHYSLSDTHKSDKYIKLMKELIQKFYQSEMEKKEEYMQNQPPSLQQQQIQT